MPNDEGFQSIFQTIPIAVAYEVHRFYIFVKWGEMCYNKGSSYERK
jgi:hypothetical protein